MEITLKPTIKQHYAYQVLESNKLEYIHLLFGGAAGGGKSWLGCEWLIENCIRYPDTKWFIGREELKELRSSTLLTFFKVCKHHGLKPDIHYKFNGQDNYITFYNGSRIDLLDLRYLPRDPLYERYGSLEYTGGWLEEAGEVRFEAYDILKSRIGRWNNDKYGLNSKLLITGNPKKNWLYYTFYKPWRDKILPDELAFVQAFVDDNPYGESNYKNNLLSITDKATKERLLYGNWEYDDDPAKLIEYDNILDIFTNDFVKPGEKYITADIARFGRDKTVIGVWNGYRLEYLATIARNKITEAADKIKQIRNTEFIPLHNIVVDEDGVGCIVPGTEVLTINGWKKVDEIKAGEQIYTKNISNIVTIETVLKNVYREPTDIIRLKNGYEFSYSHFIPCKTRREYPVKMKSWDSICNGGQVYLENDFNWSGKDNDIIFPAVKIKMPNGGIKICSNKLAIKSKAFARLMGWYLSEGYLDGKYIGIAQSVKSPHNKIIGTIIKDCGLSYYRKHHNGEYFYMICNKNLKNWLIENCYCKDSIKHIAKYKKIPDLIKHLSSESINAFLKEYMNGDGHLHHGMMEYATASKQMANDLHELLLKSGRYGNIRIKEKAGSHGYIYGRKIVRTTDVYNVYEWKRRSIVINHKIDKVYEGRVYNLEITGNTKLYMVRMKDGRCFWVHNGGVRDILGCKGFVNNSRPANKENYNNLKSQCYFNLAKHINNNQYFINTKKLSTTDKEFIIEELEQVKKDKIDSDGKQCVVPKDKVKELLGRSPDYSDMMMMREYFNLKKRRLNG